MIQNHGLYEFLGEYNFRNLNFLEMQNRRKKRKCSANTYLPFIVSHHGTGKIKKGVFNILIKIKLPVNID